MTASDPPPQSAVRSPSRDPVAAGQSSPFVGRDGELTALRARLGEARAGHGGLALIVGEAGIGKTALARAFAAEAHAAGVAVLWGACFEGDWQPSYGPWVEALGARARALAAADLERELGTGAAPLARLLPEVRALLPATPQAADLRPDEERFRLYEAVAQWLLTIARTGPVLLVLDDLHWADRDSLWLFRHVARAATQAALLVVATHRDPDLDFDRRGALADVLAVLRRETDYTRLGLVGFGQAQVTAYLAGAAGQELPAGMARAIHAETNGNPFFLREVFRHLVEEGTIVRRAGRWSTDVSLNALGIPDGVRQVVDRRLARLSSPARTILGLAAAFTGGVEFRTLQALADLPEEALLDGLDEARHAGLIRTITPGPPAIYDFAHAIVRHTLYDDLNPDRQARLHRRIAGTLERIHAGQEATHAAELAAQYHASRALPGGERGVHYALLAAEAARAGYAHERAVTFLRIARDLASGAEVATRADILRRLALAEAEALLLHEARQSADAASALTPTGTDIQEQAEFLATLARVLKDGGAAPDLWAPLVEQGLAILSDQHDLTWARLVLLRDRFQPLGDVPAIGEWLGGDPAAIALARTLGDEGDYARTLDSYDWRSRAETDAALALAQTWQRPTAVIRALDVTSRDLVYYHGDLRTAVAQLRELLAVSERYGAIPGQSEAYVQLGLCHAILGDQAASRAAIGQAHDLVARLGTTHRLHFAESAVRSVLAYFFEDDWPPLALTMQRVASEPAVGRGPLGLTAFSFAAYNSYRAGATAETTRYLPPLTAALERIARTTYIYSGSLDRAAATIWELGLLDYAARYRQLALDLIAANIGDGPMKSNELTVARMAALLGNLREASTYFARSRAVLETAGHHPQRAIVDYDEAQALLRAHAPDHPRIATLLDAALIQFRALSMAGWEARAIALQNQATTPAPPKATLPDGLTTREAEVLRLVAAGHTNREIATALFLSLPTVQRHIANIYAKIGARNRADATAYALRHHLADTTTP